MKMDLSVLNNPKWSQCCVNCNKNLEQLTSMSKIYTISVNLNFDSRSGVTEEVSVFDALCTIYNLKVIPHLDPSTKVPICFGCSLSLKDLYRRFREFSLLRGGSSYLTTILKLATTAATANAVSHQNTNTANRAAITTTTNNIPTSLNTVQFSQMTSPIVEIVMPESHAAYEASQLGLNAVVDVSQGNVMPQIQNSTQNPQPTDIIFDPSNLQLQQGLVEIVFNDHNAENAILASSANDFADLVTLPSYMVELAGTSASPNFPKEISVVNQPMNYILSNNNPPDVVLNPSSGMKMAHDKSNETTPKSKSRKRNPNAVPRKKPNAPPTQDRTSQNQIGGGGGGMGGKNKKNTNLNNNTSTTDNNISKQGIKRKSDGDKSHLVNSTSTPTPKAKTKKNSPANNVNADGEPQPKPVYPSIEVFQADTEPIENYRVSEVPPYSCPKCKKSCENKQSYAKHVYNHSLANQFPCPKCKLQYSKFKFLQQHCEYHHFLTPIEPPPKREIKPKEIMSIVFVQT